MVCLEDLVTLLTRRTPGDLRGARSRGNTTDVTEMFRDEEKREDGSGKSVAEKLLARTEAGATAAVLEATAAAMLKLPQRTSDASSSASPAGEPVRSPPELPQVDKGAEKSTPPVLPHVSSWFKDRRTPKGGGGEGDGVDDAERPLPADVRWALTWLLDSVFFSVKEPVEGLDRHPAVHALLENFLAVSFRVDVCCDRGTVFWPKAIPR